jgi:hypothetical protein
MPKESITGDTPSGLRVEVGWQPGLEVTVATLNRDETFQIPKTDARDSGDTQPFNGWFIHMDRTGLNRLIRALRKARDAAYGRDE